MGSRLRLPMACRVGGLIRLGLVWFYRAQLISPPMWGPEAGRAVDARLVAVIPTTRDSRG